jgi:hypothetical protein
LIQASSYYYFILKEFGEPIAKRYKEFEERPNYFEELGKSLQLISKAVYSYEQNDEKYSHIERADIDKVVKCYEEKRRWFDEKSSLLNSLKLHDDPPVSCSQIRSEKDSLDKTCWSILNKPKPKVEAPKETPATPTPGEKNGTDANQQKPAEMDVD